MSGVAPSPILSDIKALWQAGLLAFLGNGGGGGGSDGWTTVSGTTQTAAAGGKYYCTNAAGCTITLPTGIAEGEQVQAMVGTGGLFVTMAVSGATKVPSTTTTATGVGKVMAAERTDKSDEWVVVGADPLEPRFLGYYATYADLLGDYAVSSAEITALNAGDWAWVTAYGQRFVPNVAKTRMVAESRLIKLGSLAGTVASPIATVSGATSGQFSLTEPELPAYLAQAGDYIQVYALARKQNANATVLVKCRLGTLGTVSDQGISEVTITNVTNNDAVMQNTIAVLSNTGLSSTKSIARQSSAGAANQNTPSTDMTALQYFSMHVESGHASDVYVLTHFAVYLEQAL